ncbi:MAG: efflux RND transporter periplasmic adaptor subunit [Xanthobacteraceae bacterium]
MGRPQGTVLLLGFLGVSAFIPAGAEPAIGLAEQSEFECVIEPEQVVKLASQAVGVIARLDVDRGDLVRKGQVLGKLEDSVEAATLELERARATNVFSVKSAESRLQFFRRKLDRADELYKKSISSRAALEEASTDAEVGEQQVKEAKLAFDIARLEVRRAEEVVNQRMLRSPIDGVVIERLLAPGEYRDEQSPVLTLAQIDPLRVEVFVPTAYYGRIQAGTEAEIRPEKPIGGIHKATVTVVDRVLDAASGTFGVRLKLPNSELLLPAGIRCKVRFEMRTAQTTQEGASPTGTIASAVSDATAPTSAVAETRQR